MRFQNGAVVDCRPVQCLRNANQTTVVGCVAFVIDEVVTVQNDVAFEMSRMLAKVEGIPGGISTGANLAAALTVAARSDMAGKTIVTFAPSSAERYFSSELFLPT